MERRGVMMEMMKTGRSKPKMTCGVFYNASLGIALVFPSSLLISTHLSLCWMELQAVGDC